MGTFPFKTFRFITACIYRLSRCIAVTERREVYMIGNEIISFHVVLLYFQRRITSPGDGTSNEWRLDVEIRLVLVEFRLVHYTSKIQPIWWSTRISAVNITVQNFIWLNETDMRFAFASSHYYIINLTLNRVKIKK